MEETENSQKTDKPWLFKPGVSGNPGGRPKNTMKSYVARKLDAMSDEEKEAWLAEHKIPGIDIWKMGEGNPAQDTDITSKGEKIVFPILGGITNEIPEDNSSRQDTETQEEA